MGVNGTVIVAIYSAIDEINKMLPEDQKLGGKLESALYGESGKLDSLGLVNLIVTTEQKVEEYFGVSIVLADEKTLSKKDSPFRTIGTLVNHISMILEGKLDGK